MDILLWEVQEGSSAITRKLLRKVNAGSLMQSSVCNSLVFPTNFRMVTTQYHLAGGSAPQWNPK